MGFNGYLKKLIIIFAVIVLIVLGYLIYVQIYGKNQNNEDNAQIANPASVYCIDNGGELEIREGAQGQYGVCIKNGKECDEWAYFRGECSFS